MTESVGSAGGVFLTVIALAFPAPLHAESIAPGMPPELVGDIWISPTGDDANPGTQQSPRRRLETAITAVRPGHTVWLMPGTYAFTSYDEYVKANDNLHVLEGCFAIGHPAWGFHRNGNPSMHVTCKDCGAWDNGREAYSVGLQMVGEDASVPAVPAASYTCQL